MTENLQADGVQSRQAGFVRYCLKTILHFLRNIMVSNKNALSFAERALLIYAIELPFGKLGKHCIKLVRKMRRQIFQQIA